MFFDDGKHKIKIFSQTPLDRKLPYFYKKVTLFLKADNLLISEYFL